MSLMRARDAFFAICVGTLCVSAAQAAVLYENGPLSGSSGFCDQGPSGCGGSGTWTYYDDFTLTSPSIVTGFDYTDWFYEGTPADYVQTNWSVWDSDPFTAAAPLATGTTAATITPNGPPSVQYLFTVTGVNPLNLVAPPGTYWLGINNTVRNGAITTAAESTHLPRNAKQSDGVTHFFNNYPDRAFRIYGNVVPEPSAAALVFVGVVVIGCRRLRRG
jgi:hypothetical protein